jgi:hypothetical protein
MEMVRWLMLPEKMNSEEFKIKEIIDYEKV